MGSGVINLLRREERRARLRFWKILALVSKTELPDCPFCKKEPPHDAVRIGRMPEYLRGVFVRAYNLRTEERKNEAEVFEEAVSDLMQEHFKKALRERKMRGEPDVGHFLLGKYWDVYIVPLK